MNPTTLGPTSRFAAPNRALSRSPSRSPSRRQPSHELDPLLSNLSPTSTLDALEATQAVESNRGSRNSILRDSVAAATTSERALGIRAALAAKKTREWYKELMAWPWPVMDEHHNGFDLPSEQDHSRSLAKYGYPKRLNELPQDAGRLDAYENTRGDLYWGSLPADVVREYENRIETISDDMETLQMDELKDYVRDVHLMTGSRRSSLRAAERSNDHLPNYNRLDDFTAIITATIMQALPTITQLYLLLDTWSVRLTILRQVPGFLACLEESQMAIKSGWNAIGKSGTPTGSLTSRVSREAFVTMRTVLETKISGLGRKLDSMLDMLEGREDFLPEKWIDNMENIEADYGTWVVETEMQVLDNELTNKESSEAIEGIKQTNHEQNAEIQHSMIEFRNLGNQWSYQPIEEPLGKETGYNSDAKPRVSCSTPSMPPATQDHESSNWSDLEPNERDRAAQDTIKTSTTLTGSFLPDHPTRRSSAGSQNAETIKTSAGSVYNLLSGLLGHGDAGVSSIDPGSASCRSFVQSSGAVRTMDRPSKEGTIDLRPVQSPDLTKIAPQGDSPGLGVLSQTFESSAASGDPFLNTDETKSSGGGDFGIKLATDSENGPPSLTTSKSLPIRTEMEILDTLEADLLEQKHGPAAKPGPLVFYKTHSRAVSNVSSDMSLDYSYPGSATSENFSNMSSPEIRDASRAEYFAGPVEVTTPSYIPKDPMSPDGIVSRQSSQRTERGDDRTTESTFPSSYVSLPTQRSRASTFKNEFGVNDIPVGRDGLFPSPGQPEPDAKARSARGMDGYDTMRLTGSYSSASPDLGRTENKQLGLTRPLTSALLRLQDEESANVALEASAISLNINNSSKSASGPQPKNVKDPANQSAVDSRPPIPPKSRHRFEDVSDLGPGSTPITVRQRSRADPGRGNSASPNSALPSSNRTPTKTPDDQLEARISSILTDIPAHIRLTSGPEADAPEVLRLDGSQDSQTRSTGSPAMRRLRSQSSVTSPPITLAPAHPKSSKMRTQNGDPEIKLYHLHQSGKAAPIKLYIRLVGENGERVMVRIGGGWADLGEYLKEYATHHGRRSVSDGRFEIQGLPRSQSSSPITPLTGYSSSHDAPRSRPSSPLMSSSRNRRLSKLASSDIGEPMTPENPAFAKQDSIPKSRDSSPASIRPSSHHSWTEDDSPMGLAGPRTKKVEISPRKQAWVDDMVDQARNTSAEKKKAGDGDFGDLGKVGGTKRVFMKSKKEG